ncbi:hypothetical protein BaRGS_00000793 [Batillaria attramentaria]|uniref:UNC93-like protein MFSD11 n=1 Tax=Batillaria attramentaria TaxID=370345 RepID=A0ABD0M9A3_9CAEN
MYFLFILSFLKPMVWALYTGSALVGVGAAVLWTGQGNFLTINSDSETVGRNSGIFWALLQCSLLFGNLYSFLVFRGEATITDSARTHLFIGLSGAGLLGSLCLLFLRKRRVVDTDNLVSLNASATQAPDTPVAAFKRSFQLLKTQEMLILSVVFAFTGLELTFFSGVYGTCLAQNEHFNDDSLPTGMSRKGLIGISGMLIGAGEILGGGLFGLLGKRTNKYGRDPIVIMGYVVHMTAFYLAFVNLPMDSPVNESHAPTYFHSSWEVALLCSFLLGFGDSCVNTQVYSLLGFVFTEDSSPAFALFKFVQSVAAAAGFYYSNVLLLKWQLLILVIMGTGSALCFCIVEWTTTRASRSGYQRIGPE